MHNDESSVSASNSVLSRRTLIKATAWSVPTVVLLGATPAFAASASEILNQTRVSRPTEVTQYTGWTQPYTVLNIDGVATSLVAAGAGNPLVVTNFEEPLDWENRTRVIHATLQVMHWSNPTATSTSLTISASYGDKTTAATVRPRNALFTTSLSLDITPFMGNPDILKTMTVTATPSAEAATTFYLESIYLLVGFDASVGTPGGMPL